MLSMRRMRLLVLIDGEGHFDFSAVKRNNRFMYNMGQNFVIFKHAVGARRP